MLSIYRKRICVAITARPSYSRAKSLLAAISAQADLELQLIVAASGLVDRFGDVSKVIASDGFEVSSRIVSLVEGETGLTSAKTTGLGLLETASALDSLRPDVVVTIADRHETLATATAAAYMNIPLAHVQGGEVTGNIDDKVRNAITMLADYHFPATTTAAARIKRMGADPACVFEAGCPSIDLIDAALADSTEENVPALEHAGVGDELDFSQGYNIVLQHPVTTEVDTSSANVLETLEAVREVGVATFWFWPNPDAGSSRTSRRIRAAREAGDIPNVRFIKNLSPECFLRLVNGCQCLIGNSSVGIRECSYLGVPVVNIGTRQDGRERGPNVIDVSYCRRQIAKAIRAQIDHGPFPSAKIYGDGRSGKRIVGILAQLLAAEGVPDSFSISRAA